MRGDSKIPQVMPRPTAPVAIKQDSKISLRRAPGMVENSKMGPIGAQADGT